MGKDIATVLFTSPVLVKLCSCCSHLGPCLAQVHIQTHYTLPPQSRHARARFVPIFDPVTEMLCYWSLKSKRQLSMMMQMLFT